jgi:hypothetical protein
MAKSRQTKNVHLFTDSYRQEKLRLAVLTVNFFLQLPISLPAAFLPFWCTDNRYQ